ncbi:MAG: FkbM family methyltransferase, partial [Candidatus Binatia bacterium]
QVIARRLRRRGIWSPAETALSKQLLRPGMIVLDIGANIGYFTLVFARQVGPTGRVYAFEPEPDNFGLLQRNVARNGYANVTAVQAAVGQHAARQRLYKSADNLGDHRLGHGAAGRDWVEVPVVALDDFFAGSELRIDFIKMDIQGAELTALRGMRRLVATRAPLALITEFWPGGIQALGDNPETYLQELCVLGFALSVVRPGERVRLVPLEGRDALRELCARGEEVNLFCRRT